MKTILKQVTALDADAGTAASALPPEVVRELARCLPSTKLQVIAVLNVLCLHDVRGLAHRFRTTVKQVQRVRTICLRALRRQRELLWRAPESKSVRGPQRSNT